MQRTHGHLREWMHIHKIDQHIGHWIHDPRFWAMVALTFVIGLLITAAFLSESGTNSPERIFPTYSYVL